MKIKLNMESKTKAQSTQYCMLSTLLCMKHIPVYALLDKIIEYESSLDIYTNPYTSFIFEEQPDWLRGFQFNTIVELALAVHAKEPVHDNILLSIVATHIQNLEVLHHKYATQNEVHISYRFDLGTHPAARLIVALAYYLGGKSPSIAYRIRNCLHCEYSVELDSDASDAEAVELYNWLYEQLSQSPEVLFDYVKHNSLNPESLSEDERKRLQKSSVTAYQFREYCKKFGKDFFR